MWVWTLNLVFVLSTLANDDRSSLDGAIVEACPVAGLGDAAKSACFTRVFKQDILPYLKTGIPQLGIRSVDPITVPEISITFLDIRIIRWVSHVRQLVISGGSHMTRSDFVFDSRTRTVAFHATFPRLVGQSNETTVEGHIFGLPVRWFVARDPHSIAFRMDDLSVVATFLLQRTKAGFLFQLANIEHEINKLAVEQNGLLSPLREEFANWLLKQFPLSTLPANVLPSFHQVFKQIFATFLDDHALRIILGDFQWDD